MKKLIAIVVLVAVATVVVAFRPTAADAKPINKQSCKELRKTDKRIARDLGPNTSLDVKRKAANDAGKLIDRVVRLGGCLTNEEKLRTPPTSPTGAPGDAGPTPDSLAHYLLPLTSSWETLTPDELVHLGVTLCAELDTGRSIGDVSSQLIREINQHGVSATDAPQAFDMIAGYAAQNGDKSFCNRHSQKIDTYDNNSLR